MLIGSLNTHTHTHTHLNISVRTFLTNANKSQKLGNHWFGDLAQSMRHTQNFEEKFSGYYYLGPLCMGAESGGVSTANISIKSPAHKRTLSKKAAG